MSGAIYSVFKILLHPAPLYTRSCSPATVGLRRETQRPASLFARNPASHTAPSISEPSFVARRPSVSRRGGCLANPRFELRVRRVETDGERETDQDLINCLVVFLNKNSFLLQSYRIAVASPLISDFVKSPFPLRDRFRMQQDLRILMSVW